MWDAPVSTRPITGSKQPGTVSSKPWTQNPMNPMNPTPEPKTIFHHKTPWATSRHLKKTIRLYEPKVIPSHYLSWLQSHWPANAQAFPKLLIAWAWPKRFGWHGKKLKSFLPNFGDFASPLPPQKKKLNSFPLSLQSPGCSEGREALGQALSCCSLASWTWRNRGAGTTSHEDLRKQKFCIHPSILVLSVSLSLFFQLS